MTISWKKYIEKRRDRPHRELLEEALLYVTDRGTALDFGAGSLNDSKYLLKNGFKRVIAIDNDEASHGCAKKITDTNFTFIKARFQDFEYPLDAYNLINAQFALPFLSKIEFNDIFHKLLDSLKQNGIFCGQFFGINDSWRTSNSETSFHTKDEILMLFQNMKLIELREEQYDGKTALGQQKHWHVFHFIGQKDR